METVVKAILEQIYCSVKPEICQNVTNTNKASKRKSWKDLNRSRSETRVLFYGPLFTAECVPCSRVLTYMGHPHWRKSVRPQGTSPSLTTVLQATMALRLEELRQKRLQMDAAWQMLKVNSPLSRFVLESKRQAVAELEASVIIDTMK